VCKAAELAASDTAILFSAESEWATRSETLPSMKLNHWHDVRDWYRAFLNAGARADIVPLAYDWSLQDHRAADRTDTERRRYAAVGRFRRPAAVWWSATRPV
jgi:beta-galactosidase GanA